MSVPVSSVFSLCKIAVFMFSLRILSKLLVYENLLKGKSKAI